MNNKYKVLLLSITIMLVTSILLGTSYSLWSTTNTQSETNIVNVGCFTITFIDSGFNGAGDIDLKNQYPISDVEGSKLVPYKFSIKNECSIASSYVINLETSKESNFNLDYLKVKFNEETPAIYSTGLENGTIVLDSYSSSAKKLETGILEEGEEKIYTLRAWIEESATTTTPNVMGATWKGKVVVTNEATPLNNSKVTIVNNGETLNEEVVARTRYTYDLTGIDLGSATNIYCTNGAEPTMDNNTLVIDKIHEDTICTTSNSIVDTIANKLSTTKTGIVMLDDEDDVTKMTIASGKEVALDLNGKEINSIGVNETSTTYNDNHVVIRTAGKLTINDENNDGGIYTGTTARPLDTGTNGELIINGGSYNGRQSVYVDANNSSITINNGTFNSKLYQSLVVDYCNNCHLIVNDGTFVDAAVGGNNTDLTSTIEINGGTFTSTRRTIENFSGTININGGNFESTGNNTIYNAANGTININGEQATFDENDNYISGVYVHSNANNMHLVRNLGTINIDNGTFVSNGVRSATLSIDGTATVNNGNFISKSQAVSKNTGTITINNGRFYTDSSNTNNSQNNWGTCLVQEDHNGTTNINGGTFESSGIGIRNQGQGTINIRNASIKTNSYVAIQNNNYNNSGTINICKVNLLDDKRVQNNGAGGSNSGQPGYIYYHTNAFGSVTPTFTGTTANIQVKDDVCN